MKPKNRVYCNEIGRTKLLFESKKKALTFIKFNGSDIENETGIKPERAYYCECCGGWHTTSMKHIPNQLNRVKNIIRLYKQDIECSINC